MKIVFSVLILWSAIAQAQNAAPPAATPAPDAQMQKWIADLDAQWQGVFSREVTGPFDAEMGKLRQQYLTAVEANMAKATGAGDLDAVVMWRGERERVASAGNLPPEDDAVTPAAVKPLRAGWRAQAARLEKERADRARPVQLRYDRVLAQAQAQLTQKGRIDDALLLKAKREAVAKAWVGDAPAAPPAAPAEAKPLAPQIVETPPLSAMTVGLAKVETKDITITPLAKGQRVWSDREVLFTKISPSFQGYKFTQSPAHSPTLRFKVLTDGTVYLACMGRWGSTAAPEVAKDFMTQEKLGAAGWVRLGRDELETTASDALWLVFLRRCKAGEEFSYRTDKYASPILLVK
jgi:hypothetical protein